MPFQAYLDPQMRCQISDMDSRSMHLGLIYWVLQPRIRVVPSWIKWPRLSWEKCHCKFNINWPHWLKCQCCCNIIWSFKCLPLITRGCTWFLWCRSLVYNYSRRTLDTDVVGLPSWTVAVLTAITSIRLNSMTVYLIWLSLTRILSYTLK